MTRSTCVRLGFVLGLMLVPASLSQAAVFDYAAINPTNDIWVASQAGTPAGTGIVSNSGTLRVMNATNDERILLKYTLPTGWTAGQATGTVLELVFDTYSAGTINPNIYLYQSSVLQSDNTTPWTETNTSYNLQPTLGALLDTKANTGDKAPTSFNSANSAFQFSSAALDSTINAAGPGGTLSFTVLFANVSGSREELYYSKENGTAGRNPTLNFNVIPEPGSLAIAGLGGVLFAIRRRH